MLTCMLTLACQGADVCFLSVEHKVVSFGCKQIGSFDQSDQPCIFASLRYLTGICVTLLQMSCRGGFRRGGCFSMCLVGWGENDAPLLSWGLWQSGFKTSFKKKPFYSLCFQLVFMGLHTQYVHLFECEGLVGKHRQNVFFIRREQQWLILVQKWSLITRTTSF